MPRNRLSYGERSCCQHCDQDIEWHGRAHGWIDRGGNRSCVSFRNREGEIVRPTTKHRP